jgi:hypothetical protein
MAEVKFANGMANMGGGPRRLAYVMSEFNLQSEARGWAPRTITSVGGAHLTSINLPPPIYSFLKHLFLLIKYHFLQFCHLPSTNTLTDNSINY